MSAKLSPELVEEVHLHMLHWENMRKYYMSSNGIIPKQDRAEYARMTQEIIQQIAESVTAAQR